MSLLIKNGEIVTHNERYVADIFCEGETITQIERDIAAPNDCDVIDARGKYVFPGFPFATGHVFRRHLNPAVTLAVFDAR